jgi:uncharacterized protein
MNASTQPSWISSKIEIKESALGGAGMFAKEEIQAGEKAVIFGGVYTDENGAEQAQKQGKLVMQWDDDLWSVEERGDDPTYFVNHSCDPNLWMQDAFTLIARKDIQRGEEITADYALWEADEGFVSQWACHCGSPRCRGKVTGKDWQLPELQQTYQQHFSPFINKRISQAH